MDLREAERLADKMRARWFVGFFLAVMVIQFLVSETYRQALGISAVFIAMMALFISLASFVDHLKVWCHALYEALERVGILHTSLADYRTSLIFGAIPKRIEGWSGPANLIKPFVPPPVTAEYEIDIHIHQDKLVRDKAFSRTEERSSWARSSLCNLLFRGSVGAADTNDGS